MTVKVTVKGGAALSRKLRTLETKVRKAAVQSVHAAALDLEAALRRAARESLRDVPEDGRALDGDGRRLDDSVFADTEFDRPSAQVGTEHPFGRDLEFGTTATRARPWLFPTFERMKPKLRDRIEKAIAAAVRNASRG